MPFKALRNRTLVSFFLLALVGGMFGAPMKAVAAAIAAPAMVWQPSPEKGATPSEEWKELNGEVYLDGTALAAAANGSALTYPFTGAGVRVIGMRCPQCGKIDISLDGRFVAQVDLVASETLQQQVLFETSGLEPASHTLEVRAVRAPVTAPDQQESPQVVIDGFAVLSAQTADQAIAYPAPTGITGEGVPGGVTISWKAATDTTVSGYRVYRSWEGAPAPVLLTPQIIKESSYTDTAVTEGVTYSYTVRSVHGAGVESADSPAISAVAGAPQTAGPDAVEVTATLTETPHLPSRGTTPPGLPGARLAGSQVDLTWAPPSDWAPAGYHVWARTSPDDPFYRLTKQPVRGPGYGDTAPPEASTVYYAVTAVDAEGLETERSAEVSVTVAKPKAPATFSLMSVTEAGATVTTTEESDPAMGFSSNWSGDNNAGHSGGSAKYSATAGSAVSFAFTGNQVRWIGTTCNSCGKAKVYVDDVLNATVVLGSSAAERGKVVWQSLNLGGGAHTVKVEVVGEPSPGFSGNNVYVDAFAIAVGDDTTPPAPPEGLTLERANTQLTLTWSANLESDRFGYHVYRASGTTYQRITPTAITGTSFTDTGLTNGVSYTYVVTTVDTIGNESVQSASATMEPAATADFYEEDDPGILYSAGWYRDWASESRSSYHSRSSTQGATAQLTFYGTGIRWWTPAASSGGDVEVILDGQLVKTVNLYQGYTEYQLTFDKMKLTPKVHTVQLRIKGTRDGVAGSYNGWIDSLEVVDSSDDAPASPPAELRVVSGNAAAYLYWTPNLDADFWGYNVYRSEQPDTGFVRLNYWTLRHGTTFTDTGLTNGKTYYYHLTAIDQFGNESGKSTVVGTVPLARAGVYQEDSAGVELAGTWNHDWDGNADGSMVSSSRTTGDTATITFTGTGVRWYSTLYSNRGEAKVYVDGVLSTTVDLYNSTVLYKQKVFETLTLSEGQHTLRIEVTGVRHPSSSDSYVTVDKFEVLGGPTWTKVEDTSKAVDYSRLWWRAWDNTVTEQKYAAAVATYEFYGTGIYLAASSTYNSGKVKVTIDNEPPVIVDLWRPSSTYGWIPFRREGLERGRHKIILEVLGQRNPSSGDTYVPIDGFYLIDTDEADPPAPAVTAAAEPGKVTLSWAEPRADVVGYNVYRYRGLREDGKVNLPYIVRGTSFVDQWLVPGQAYTYRVSAVSSTGKESVLSEAVAVTLPMTLPAGEPAPAGTPGAGTYAEDHSGIVYSTGWSRDWDGQSNGSYHQRTNTVDATATFVFDGTGIQWKGIRLSSSGVADVYIDGVLQASVSTYAPTTVYKQLLFQVTHLPAGKHTLEIRNRRLSAWGAGNIYIDDLVVLNDTELTVPAVPADLAAVRGNTTVNLSWTANTEADLAGYRVYRATAAAGPYVPLAGPAPYVVGTNSYQDSGLMNGTQYYYLVTAVDKNGNESAESTVVSMIPAALRNTAVQENDPGLQWNGSWSHEWETRSSGSYHGWTNRDDGSVTVYFEGTGIRWRALTGPYNGKVDVYVDDVWQKTVDLYAGTWNYQADVFRKYGLTMDTVHKLELRNVGKNPSSYDDRLYVDYFEVLYSTDVEAPGAPVNPSVYSESAYVELYWSHNAESDLAGYYVERQEAGTATWTRLNDNPITGQSLYVDDGVANGTTYTYRVVAADTAGNESAASVTVTTLVTAPPARYQENSRGVVRTGSWTAEWGGEEEGTYHIYSTTVGSAVELTFSGTRVKWMGRKYSNMGKAEVYVDGVLAATVDQYAANYQPKQVLFETLDLAAGKHTLKVVVKGEKSSSSSGTNVAVDAFEVLGPVPPRQWVDDTTQAIDYRERWWRAWDNTVAENNISAAKLSYTFYGTGVELVVHSDYNSGRALVSLDGQAPVLVDLYRQSSVWNWKAYRITGLPQGQHTIMVAPAGTKNPGSGGTYVPVNGFYVLETDDTAPPAPVVTAAAETGKATLSWSQPRADVVGYNVYRYRGLREDGKVNLPYIVRGTSFVDQWLVPGQGYTYRVSAVSSTGKESVLSEAVTVTLPTTLPTGEPAPAGTPGAGTYAEDHSGIVYSSGWSREWDPQSNGSYHQRTNTVDATATFVFDGTGVQWKGIRLSSGGVADVYIDGELKAVVSTYAPSTVYKQLLFQATHLPARKHTLEIRNRRLSTWGAGNIYIDDLVVMNDTELTVPAVPADLAAVRGNTTVNLNWTANMETELAGYRVYRATAAAGPYVPLAGPAPYVVGTNSYQDSGLKNGIQYYYLVAAIDKNGNESAESAMVSMMPAALRNTAVQENDVGLQWNGSWSHDWESRSSGSYHGWTNRDDGSVTVYFEGTGIRWRALTGPYHGKVDVYVDNVWQKTVDLYAGTWNYQADVFRKYGLTMDTVHKLELRNAGKNPSSYDDRLYVDYFEVLYSTDVEAPGAPVNPSVYSESAYVELYWSHNPESDLAGYYVERQEAGAATWMRLNENPVTGQSVYVDYGVANGTTYTYRVVAADTAGNESAASVTVTTLVTALPGRYQQNSRGVVQTGSWTEEWHGDEDGDTHMYSTTAGSTAEITFSGTDVKWIGRKYSNMGKADVYVDGVLAATVDQYAANYQPQQMLFEKLDLVPGKHTLKIVVKGEKSSSSSGTNVAVDAFEVLGPVPPRQWVDDTTQAIDYRERWWRAWDNTVAENNISAAKLTYTFYGTGVELVVHSDSNSGQALVSLDGQAPVLVDLYRQSSVWNWKAYRITGLAPGQHTITVAPAGTRNPGSGGTYVPVNGFYVLETDDTVPPAPVVTAAAEPGKATLSWSQPRADVVGYNVYRYRGLREDGKVNLPYIVRGTSFVDQWLVPGQGYTYRVSAVSSTGKESALSEAVAVTLPMTLPAGEPAPAGTPGAGTYAEDHSGIVYSTGWSRDWDGQSNGSYHQRTNTVDATATFVFEGTGIQWKGIRLNSGGVADVYIDGVLKATVGTYATSTVYKQLLFQVTHLPAGKHTLEIRNRRLSTWGAGNIYIDDLVVMNDTELTAPAVPADLAAVRGNTTVNLSWTANTETDLAGYRVYRATAAAGPYVPLAGPAPYVVGTNSYQDSGLKNGTEYYYLVTAVDKNGNESLTASASAVPLAPAGFHEENNVGWVYTGTWNAEWDSKNSGNYRNFSNSDNATATFTFYGTVVRWFAMYSNYSGKVDVYLDGNYETTVDLYYPAWRYYWVGFQKGGLAPGMHKLELRNAGKNPASNDDRLYVDAIEVLDNVDTTPPVAPQALRAVTDSGETHLFWTVNPDPDVEGYRVYRGESPTGPFSLVSNDAERYATRGRTTYQHRYPADARTYYYQVRAVDKHGNESAGSTAVAVTAAAHAGKYQEDWWGHSLSAGWESEWNGESSGSVHYRSKTAGTTVSLGFKGTGIRWTGWKGPGAGQAEVSVDGVSRGVVSLYHANWLSKQTLFEDLTLSDGVHTITVTVKGTKDASAYDYWVYLDTLEVAGPAADYSRVEQQNYVVSYTGAWMTSNDGGHSGGSLSYINGGSYTVTYVFYGTGIDVRALRNIYDGQARVYLDNEPIVVIDEWYPSAWYQYPVFRRRGLPLTLHTLRIERIGVKNPNAESANLNLDAFDVYGADTAVPDQPTNFKAQAGVYHATVSWDQPNPDVVGYRIYRRHDVYAPVQLNEHILRANSYRDDGLAPNTTYYYKVVAIDSLGQESGASAELAVTTGNEGDAPPAPTGLTGTVSPAGIALSWDGLSTAMDHYTVYRAPSPTGPWALLGTVPYGTNQYADKTTAGGVTYYYQVTVTSLTLVESKPSNTLEITSMRSVRGTARPEYGSKADVQVEVMGTAYSTHTNADGDWDFENLPDGAYQVRFSKPGYKTVIVDVFVQFGQAQVDPIVLRFGDLDADDDVDIVDRQLLMLHYGEVLNSTTPPAVKIMDALEDQVIDVYDLARLTRNIEQ